MLLLLLGLLKKKGVKFTDEEGELIEKAQKNEELGLLAVLEIARNRDIIFKNKEYNSILNELEKLKNMDNYKVVELHIKQLGWDDGNGTIVTAVPIIELNGSALLQLAEQRL